MYTKFNPQNKESLTVGECLDAAMKITDKQDAIQYKRDYIAFIQKSIDKGEVKDKMTAEQIANANLGYCAGYYSSETRIRVEELFSCSHPVFGSVKEDGIPTTDEAFEAGKKLAQTR